MCAKMILFFANKLLFIVVVSAGKSMNLFRLELAINTPIYKPPILFDTSILPRLPSNRWTPLPGNNSTGQTTDFEMM